MSKCFIVLENGSVFEGARFGASTKASGELVFTTSIGGHMQTLTDPCYKGQIVLQTFPLVGNYGVIPSESDSNSCHLNGYIVREWCKTPVNFQSSGDIDSFLKLHDIAGVYGVDTRQITRIIRENGSMRAAIVDEVTQDVIDALQSESTPTPPPIIKPATHQPLSAKRLTVALINLGAPHNIIPLLTSRGALVYELPLNAKPDEITALGPDALIISDGPGDPSIGYGDTIKTLKVLSSIPALGIGMGHMLMAAAHGAETYKLKHGHRGSNQPIMQTDSGQVYITSLNQGYAANAPVGATVTYINFNDKSVAGLDYGLSMSVQFVPDSTLGPLKTDFIYDEIIKRVVG